MRKWLSSRGATRPGVGLGLRDNTRDGWRKNNRTQRRLIKIRCGPKIMWNLNDPCWEIELNQNTLEGEKIRRNLRSMNGKTESYSRMKCQRIAMLALSPALIFDPRQDLSHRPSGEMTSGLKLLGPMGGSTLD